MEEQGAEEESIAVLRLEIYSEQEGECPFTILADDGVYWTPFYEIGVENTETPLSVRLRAKIHRFAGKDWDKVSIRLIYGNKNREGTRPELSPWILDAPIPPRRSFLAMEKSCASLDMLEETCVLSEGNASKGRMPLTTPSAPATEAITEVLSQYILPGIYHVEAGTDTVIDVLEESVPALYMYSVVPKLDSDVFLTAAIEHPEKYKLLPCQAYVMYNHLSVGVVTIPKEVSGEPFVLSLGRDEGLLTKREKTVDEFAEATLTGRKTRKVSYEICVTNRKGTAVALEIRDQVPIVRDEKIRVVTQNLSGGVMDADTGEVVWKVEAIQPDETIERIMAFTVSYPRNTHINMT